MTKNLVISGDFIINTNGTVSHAKSTLTVKGDWINNGTYTTTNSKSKIIFGGNSQLITGSSVTTFRDVVINAGSILTLGADINVTGSGSSFYVNGTFDPGQSPTYTITSSVLFQVSDKAIIKVNAATFAANYNLSGTVTLAAGSSVEYSSTTVDQTISSAYTYSDLVISGTGTKSLTANLPSLNSSGSTRGNIYVKSGTLDIGSFTVNRGTSNIGGSFNLSNGAYLKIGASNFPANYNNYNLQLGSTSEYNGTTQTISAKTYGNLIFSSKSGASIKTLPATNFTVEGNFSVTNGSGTSVAFTAASNVTINGNVDIGASTTFNGGAFSHTIGGNWVNNGIFNGNTSTISFDGPSSIISGTGTQNFNNINFLVSGITASSGTSLNISGNIATSGPGQFTHLSGGLITMTGSSKLISGDNLVFNDLTISGSVSTNASFAINSNFSIPGSFSADGGTIDMVGTTKTITGTTTIGFSTLRITGSIVTNANFSISSLLDVGGTFSASAGTATFTGTSELSGIANLYNITLNCTSLKLSATSTLGIANTMTITAGSLDVTSGLPNTVNFNGTGAQSIRAITYNNLILSNGGTKTAAGNISVNGNITIASSTTFAGGSYSHSILGNWINNGTFTPSTGTIQFTGVNNASITGTTTFNILTLNKSVATTTLTLFNNISVGTVNMSSGKMLTGSNKVTITTTRTGNGIIIGTITRTHAFAAGTAYAFEGPYNTITFLTAVGVTSITETVVLGTVADFPNNASINREYNIVVTGVLYVATLRLHYEDAGLNGNNESQMGLWNNLLGWTSIGKTASDPTNNYIEQSGLINISSRWTCSEVPGVARWNGSVSSDWNTAANWTNVSGTASTPPDANDIVQIGTGSFTYQATISTAVNVKGITFGSAQAATLTLATGGSLTTNGNIGGSWTGDAVHTINAGNQNFIVNGDLTLSNGTSNRSINLNMGSGTTTILGTLTQKGNASINFSGNGSLRLGGDFVYNSGNFTPGSGTVLYNGTDQQEVANVSYNNVTVNNTLGNVSIPRGVAIALAGNLSLLSGQLEIDTTSITINGNVTINSGATLNCHGVSIAAAGNWTNGGSYLSTTGTVTLNGSAAQNISGGNFNNLTINKSSGSAVLTGNNTLAGNFSIISGTLDLSSYTLNRQSQGGTFSMASGTLLQLAGSNNFPSKYSTYTLNAASTVLYNGSLPQSVAGVTYGNLTLSNGGSNQKTQLGNLTAAGNLLINSGATFNSGGYTATLIGNWTNNGIFNASTGGVILNGTGKTLTGNTTFNRVTVNGSYTVSGSDMVYNGLLWVTTGASYISDGHATVSGDLTNNGTLIGNGTTTFTGTSVQTIRLVNALVSSSTGIINFNGNVSPILNSNSSPQFATLNINNTAGLNPSVGATVYIALNVNTGAKLNTANATYTIYGSFTNAGTVTSAGILNFMPVTAKTIALGSSGFSSDGTVNFGGTGQITLTGKPDHFNTVIITNTNSAGFSPSSDWVVDSNFVVNEHAIFNAGSYTYTVGNDIISDGTLNGESSTFISNSNDGELSASSEAVFNHLINNGTLSPQTDYNVAGDFTNNGTYDGSIGTLIMTGSNAANIGGTTTPSTIAQLTIQKSNNAVVTQKVNMSELSFLNIVSGSLFTSTFTITQDASGGILVINDSATLKLGGTNSLPGFSGYGLSVNSNVDYAGVSTTQAVGNAADYGNLIISGTGNKNAYTALTVLGSLYISAGALNTNTITVQHSIAGDFLMTGGVLSGTNSTYILNGTNDQTLTLLSNLIKLTVNKSSGSVNLGSDVTVNNILTFTSGNIKTGNYKVVIPSTGTVNGAGQSTGWVNGNLQKYVATGASVSRTFEIGDSVYYTPASLLFSNVSTAGNFIAKATPTDHPNADNSGLDTTKSINRYWTLTNAGVVFTSASATFNWVPSDIDAGANYSNFKTAAFSGTNWLLNDVSNPLSTSIKAINCTGFGDFQIGEILNQYRWTGGAMTSDWNTKENWIGGVPTAAFNTLIPSGVSGGRVYPLLTSGTSVVKDLIIESSATLSVNGGNLQITGAINNSGMLDASNGTIEMKGTGAQSIAGSMFNMRTIKNLIVSNTGSGLSVSSTTNDTLKITGTLSFGNSNSILNTGDNITLVSNSAGTANVGIVGAGNAINGKVIVERYINTGTGTGQHGKSWQLLATPTVGQSVKESWMENGSLVSTGYGTQISGPGGTNAGFDLASSAPSFKSYNSLTDGWSSIANTNDAIYNSKGYLVFVRGDRSVTLNKQPNSTVLRTKGALITGSLSSISVVPGKWESLGNPYASPIDFTLITKDAGIDDKFYVWDPYLYGTYGLGGYQTLSSANNWEPVPGGTAAYKTGVPSKIIQSGQAFFIHATSDPSATYSLTFTESCKANNSASSNFARYQDRGASANQRQYLRTSLFTGPDGIMADGNTVAFYKSFSNTVDGNDALKMTNSGENFGLKRDGQLLSIEAKGTVTTSDTIYYNMSNLKVRTYQLRFAPVNMDKNGLEAYLLDQFLNTSTAISLTDSSFVNIEITSNAASSAANRFKVVFKSMSVLPVTVTSVKAYSKEKNITIEWKVENESNMLEHEVEKSVDGINYVHASTLPALNKGTGKYIWIDQQAVSGNNYYRIRIKDQDGSAHYTEVVKASLNAIEKGISVYPNPIVNNTINLFLTNQPLGTYGVWLLNSLGEVIMVKNFSHTGGSKSEKIEKAGNNLPKGIYQLEVSKPDGNQEIIRILK
jgi:hypothetical protein